MKIRDFNFLLLFLTRLLRNYSMNRWTRRIWLPIFRWPFSAATTIFYIVHWAFHSHYLLSPFLFYFYLTLCLRIFSYTVYTISKSDALYLGHQGPVSSIALCHNHQVCCIQALSTHVMASKIVAPLCFEIMTRRYESITRL